MACGKAAQFLECLFKMQSERPTSFLLDYTEEWAETVKLAPSCTACDIPASRKVSGFPGHSAALGCSKCLKNFGNRTDGTRDCSGYDEENWVKRDATTHRKQVGEIGKGTTKTGTPAAEAKYGVRYSVLLALSYFDPVRFTVIDAMHNLFLGTGKHMFQAWLQNNLLTTQRLEEVESRIASFKVPSDISRLPVQISSDYGAFTAKQWKNWILIYSPVVLKGLLPSEHMGCWLLFVCACCAICMPLITRNDAESSRFLSVSQTC